MNLWILTFASLMKSTYLKKIKESIFIFVHIHASQIEFKEIFHLPFIVMLKKIFLLEISFEFTLWYPLLIKVLGFLKLIPPHGFPSLQVVGLNYSFYSGCVIIHLEILLHLKHPGLNLFSFLVILFSFLVITIESKRFNIL